MFRTHRARGFTLVELLVVITIIGMLMSLLLPAIQSARESGRKSVCANNIRQAGIAMTGFHDNKRSYPGYSNVINGKRASWVVSILPFMERNDLYQMWQNNAPAPPSAMEQFDGPTISDASGAKRPNPWAYTRLDILVCPSNPTSATSSNPLSYVVNCGADLTANDLIPDPAGTLYAGASWFEDINAGVFFNNARADWTASGSINNPTPAATDLTGGGPRISNDFISTNDGTSYTLMLAENLQATNWVTNPLNTLPALYSCEFQIKQNTGFVWFITNVGLNNINSPPPNNTQFYPAAMRINGQAKNVSQVPLLYNPAGIPYPEGGLAFSRPSSAHPGGVNVIFCDGHLGFIAEDIGYNVYTQLCTPKQNSVLLNAAGTATPRSLGWTYTLNEADYR